NYLQHNDRSEEALQLLQDNVRFFEFRMMLVDHALSSKNFEQAKELCRDGLKEAKKKGFGGNSTRWKVKLYQIAEMEEAVPVMRKWAEELFFNGYNTEWYNALKNTYSSSEWPDRCEALI